MARIEFRGVTKRYDDVLAVDDLTLDIADGELMVLLGPSGCGKSTALRLIAGLETPTGGSVLINGEVVNDTEAKDRDVAMVFQSYALYPHMNVRRNIAFPLKPLGIGKAERHERAATAAELLGLGELLDRKPGQLSGGQRQRVALARALVREPRAFLMDEPLSNLDAKLRAETRTELVALHERLGKTIVFVTHDQVEAMTMADRIAILVDGRLQQVGTPEAIYADPANVFVARFIGSPPMNTWPGALTPDLVTPADRVPVEVIVGARPEDFVFGDTGMEAMAVGVESLGHERLVSCKLASGDEATVRIDGKEPFPRMGEPVHLVPDPGEVALFDAESGERLR